MAARLQAAMCSPSWMCRTARRRNQWCTEVRVASDVEPASWWQLVFWARMRLSLVSYMPLAKSAVVRRPFISASTATPTLGLEYSGPGVRPSHTPTPVASLTLPPSSNQQRLRATLCSENDRSHSAHLLRHTAAARRTRSRTGSSHHYLRDFDGPLPRGRNEDRGAAAERRGSYSRVLRAVSRSRRISSGAAPVRPPVDERS